MRVLFLLLVLVNLAFFGINYHQPKAAAPTLPAADPGVEPLRLIRERSSTAAPATVQASAPASRAAQNRPAPEARPEKPAKVQSEAPPAVAAATDTAPSMASSPPTPAPVATAPSAPPVPAAAVPASRAPSARPAESAGTGGIACFSVGPLGSREAAEALQRRLAAAGVEAEPRMREQREIANYWVHLPATDSPEAAQQTAHELGEKGLEDYGVVADGATRIVSVGIYNQIEPAERRKHQLESMGYEVLLVPRERTRTEYWVDYHQRPGSVLPDDFWKPAGDALAPQTAQCS